MAAQARASLGDEVSAANAHGAADAWQPAQRAREVGLMKVQVSCRRARDTDEAGEGQRVTVLARSFEHAEHSVAAGFPIRIPLEPVIARGGICRWSCNTPKVIDPDLPPHRFPRGVGAAALMCVRTECRTNPGIGDHRSWCETRKLAGSVAASPFDVLSVQHECAVGGPESHDVQSRIARQRALGQHWPFHVNFEIEIPNHGGLRYASSPGRKSRHCDKW